MAVPFTGRWYMKTTAAADMACKPPLLVGAKLPASCCSDATIVSSIQDFATDQVVCMEDSRSTVNGSYELQCNGSNPVLSMCDENCTACSERVALGNHECIWMQSGEEQGESFQWYVLMDQYTCPSNANQRCPPIPAKFPTGRFLTLPSTLAAPGCKGKTVGDELSMSCCSAAKFEENVLFFDEQGLCVETADVPRVGDTYRDFYTCLDGVPSYTDCGTVQGCSTKFCKTAPYQSVPGKCVYTKPLQGEKDLIEWYLLMDYGACSCRYTAAPTAMNSANKKGLFLPLIMVLLLQLVNLL